MSPTLNVHGQLEVSSFVYFHSLCMQVAFAALAARRQIVKFCADSNIRLQCCENPGVLTSDNEH